MPKIDHESESNSKSLRSKIFNLLENDIIKGKYQPGDNLIETRLSSEMGVSRTPIREAITQLELEGLVKVIPNKGAIVIGISDKDIEDIYKIRMLIEGLASRWAAKNIKGSAIEELQEICELAEFYTHKNKIDHLLELDTQFHDVIYRATTSMPMIYILKTFHYYIKKAREISLTSKDRSIKVLKEHKDILEAIISGNENEAEELTYNHVKNASEHFLKQIKKSSYKV